MNNPYGGRDRVGTLSLPVDEVRGLFVATAYNIDWPSQPGLDTPEQQQAQKDEIDTIVQRAVDLGFNTIFLQVRAFGDRIYSEHTSGRPWIKSIPWAWSLNYGWPPGDEGYDPLKEWICRCHANGLQIFAWMNPYRTDQPISYDYQGVTTQLPCYWSNDGHMYMDETSDAVQDYLWNVVDDLVTAYQTCDCPQSNGGGGGDGDDGGDEGGNRGYQPAMATTTTTGGDDDGLDGVVVDHYFPDPELGVLSMAAGSAPMMMMLDAPGSQVPALPPRPYTPKKQTTIDATIAGLFERVSGKGRIFAISPLDNQRGLSHAHVGDWLAQGKCHYFMPEIYTRGLLDFKRSLNYWNNLNTGGKPRPTVVPVLFTTAVMKKVDKGKLWSAKEIENEVRWAQAMRMGQAHYGVQALQSERRGGPSDNVGDLLKSGAYKTKALIPEVTIAPKYKQEKGIADEVPAPTVRSGVGWASAKSNSKVPIRVWAYQLKRRDGTWGDLQTAPGGKSRRISISWFAKGVRVMSVDRYGRKSKWVEPPSEPKK